MNDQTPLPPSQPDSFDRHTRRQQRREARHESLGGTGSGLTWVAGILLILLGIAFLLQNMGTYAIPLTNWWALFILLPALGAFDAAYRAYKNAGNHLHASARGSVLGGLILTFIAASFLFNFDWNIFGPILIILAGIGILINYMLPGKD